MTEMRVKMLVRCVVNGRPTSPGSVVDVPSADGRSLVFNKQAEQVSDDEPLTDAEVRTK